MTMTMSVDANVSDNISLESSSSSDEIDNLNPPKQLNVPSNQDNGHSYDLDMSFDNSADSIQGTNSDLENDHPCIHISDVTMPINNEVCFTCLNQNNDSVPTAPTIMVHPLQNPIANYPMNVCDVEQLRLYIKKEVIKDQNGLSL